MQYPSLSRSNMRYRGPMESRKLNKVYADTYYDLSHLYKRLEELKENVSSFRDEMRKGGEEMSEQFSFIRYKAGYLKGGDSRE